MADELQSILQAAPIDQKVKADAWEAYRAARSTDDLTKRLQWINLPNDVKAKLGELKEKNLAPKTAYDIFDEVAAEQRTASHKRWIWAAALSTIPPPVLYLLLFFVAPWIYRGFRPTQV